MTGAKAKDILPYRALGREMLTKSYRMIVLSCLLLLPALGSRPALAMETNDLIGRWGVSSYFADKDAAAMRAAAASACGQPYVIARGKGGRPVMYAAFSGKRVEVVVQGDSIVNADGDDAMNTKTILAADARSMLLRYANEEANQRYGTMIFVRCGR